MLAKRQQYQLIKHFIFVYLEVMRMEFVLVFLGIIALALLGYLFFVLFKGEDL